MSLINGHSLDPALLYNVQELIRACERYQVDTQRGENEEDNVYQARLLKVGRGLTSKHIRREQQHIVFFPSCRS